MGLHVSAVSELPLSEERSYYIYVLDYYNWNEPISQTLHANESRIASFCSKNNAIMITGLPDSHFYSEVLSWVKINGEGPSRVLPALLITTIHPRYFIEANNSSPDPEISEALIFLKIRDICKTPTDVVDLLEKIFHDISNSKKIKDFTITRELKALEGKALVDALILEPSIAGFGVDIKKLVSWGKQKINSAIKKA